MTGPGVQPSAPIARPSGAVHDPSQLRSRCRGGTPDDSAPTSSTGFGVDFFTVFAIASSTFARSPLASRDVQYR